ncbi:hypothetical protein AKO1_011684 [Acrasis kona]|uniref:DRBM domain-containing protein n=1 Tax=Acrasis kona TaxID=1008807 RepID=A0AAW2Z7R5_9EUKA
MKGESTNSGIDVNIASEIEYQDSHSQVLSNIVDMLNDERNFWLHNMKSKTAQYIREYLFCIPLLIEYVENKNPEGYVIVFRKHNITVAGISKCFYRSGSGVDKRRNRAKNLLQSVSDYMICQLDKREITQESRSTTFTNESANDVITGKNVPPGVSFKIPSLESVIFDEQGAAKISFGDPVRKGSAQYLPQITPVPPSKQSPTNVAQPAKHSPTNVASALPYLRDFRVYQPDAAQFRPSPVTNASPPFYTFDFQIPQVTRLFPLDNATSTPMNTPSKGSQPIPTQTMNDQQTLFEASINAFINRSLPPSDNVQNALEACTNVKDEVLDLNSDYVEQD